MPVQIKGTEIWSSPAPGESRTFSFGAGVTPRMGVQIKNATNHELWVMQGTVAPKSREQAQFIVSPNMTGNYPLNDANISLTWAGDIQVTTDLITIAATDGEVTTPQEWPGVQQANNGTNPIVYRELSGLSPFGLAYLGLGQTLTRAPIGAVFVFNPTFNQLALYDGNPQVIPNTSTLVARIPPFTAMGIQCLIDSGNAYIGVDSWFDQVPPVIGAGMYCYFTDIYNSARIPVTASKLNNLLESPWMATLDASGVSPTPARVSTPLTSYNTSVNTAGGATVNIATVPAGRTLVVYNARIGVQVAGNVMVARLQFMNGYNGWSGVNSGIVLRVRADQPAHNYDSAEIHTPVLGRSNPQAGTLNILQFYTENPSGHTSNVATCSVTYAIY